MKNRHGARIGTAQGCLAVALTILACLGLSGCAHLSGDSSGVARSSGSGDSGDAESAATIGMFAGLTAAMASGNEEFAGVASQIGGLLGRAAGEGIAEKREEMVQERSGIEEELAETDRRIGEFQQRNKGLQNEIVTIGQSIDQMEKERAASVLKQEDKQKLIDDLKQKQQDFEGQAALLERAITALEDKRRESESLTDGQAAKLDSQISTLRSELATMESELDALASLRVRAGGI